MPAFSAFFFLLLAATAGLSAPKKTKPPETVQLTMTVSGDLRGEYDFSGGLGAELEGVPAEEKTPCEVTSLFRKVTYRTKPALEAWLTFLCTTDGQKSTYKPDRIFIPLTSDDLSVKLPVLSEKIKNIRLQFEAISFKISK